MDNVYFLSSPSTLNISNPFISRLFLVHLPSQVWVHQLHLVFQLGLVCPQQLDNNNRETNMTQSISYLEVKYVASPFSTRTNLSTIRTVCGRTAGELIPTVSLYRQNTNDTHANNRNTLDITELLVH